MRTPSAPPTVGVARDWHARNKPRQRRPATPSPPHCRQPSLSACQFQQWCGTKQQRRGAPAASSSMLRAPGARLLAHIGLCSRQAASRNAAGAASGTRALTSEPAPTSVEDEVDIINEKFAEAREEIEFAREDAETVYFNDSADEARRVVGEVLDRWAALLQRLPADEQAKLQRAMGLKMEQLRAELRELDELHA